MRAQLLPILGPRIEVILHCNRSPDALTRAHAPELLERSGAVDGRLVRAGRL